MNRAELIKWIDEYEALKIENANLHIENASLCAETAQLKAVVADQEAKIKDLETRPAASPERTRLEEKYKNLKFMGKCTMRQFTIAAYTSLYPRGVFPRDYYDLFNVYFSELEGVFGLVRDRTHVIGASSRE